MCETLPSVVDVDEEDPDQEIESRLLQVKFFNKIWLDKEVPLHEKVKDEMKETKSSLKTYLNSTEVEESMIAKQEVDVVDIRSPAMLWKDSSKLLRVLSRKSEVKKTMLKI